MPVDLTEFKLVSVIFIVNIIFPLSFRMMYNGGISDEIVKVSRVTVQLHKENASTNDTKAQEVNATIQRDANTCGLEPDKTILNERCAANETHDQSEETSNKFEYFHRLLKLYAFTISDECYFHPNINCIYEVRKIFRNGQGYTMSKSVIIMCLFFAISLQWILKSMGFRRGVAIRDEGLLDAQMGHQTDHQHHQVEHNANQKQQGECVENNSNLDKEPTADVDVRDEEVDIASGAEIASNETIIHTLPASDSEKIKIQKIGDGSETRDLHAGDDSKSHTFPEDRRQNIGNSGVTENLQPLKEPFLTFAFPSVLTRSTSPSGDQQNTTSCSCDETANENSRRLKATSKLSLSKTSLTSRKKTVEKMVGRKNWLN